LGQPLTLFSLFGLLLVSAIGIDYAILMHERVAGPAASLVGMLLSAATTLLAFGLLAISATPAVASFGLAVAVGVAYGVFFAALIPPTVHFLRPSDGQRSPISAPQRPHHGTP